jgi:molybdopterin molybdotransferase
MENGKAIARPFELQDSSMLSLIAAADCLVVRPPNAPAARAGDEVGVIHLSGGRLSI